MSAYSFCECRAYVSQYDERDMSDCGGDRTENDLSGLWIAAAVLVHAAVSLTSLILNKQLLDDYTTTSDQNSFQGLATRLVRVNLYSTVTRWVFILRAAGMRTFVGSPVVFFFYFFMENFHNISIISLADLYVVCRSLKSTGVMTDWDERSLSSWLPYAVYSGSGLVTLGLSFGLAEDFIWNSMTTDPMLSFWVDGIIPVHSEFLASGVCIVYHLFAAGATVTARFRVQPDDSFGELCVFQILRLLFTSPFLFFPILDPAFLNSSRARAAFLALHALNDFWIAFCTPLWLMGMSNFAKLMLSCCTSKRRLLPAIKRPKAVAPFIIIPPPLKEESPAADGGGGGTEQIKERSTASLNLQHANGNAGHEQCSRDFHSD